MSLVLQPSAKRNATHRAPRHSLNFEVVGISRAWQYPTTGKTHRFPRVLASRNSKVEALEPHGLFLSERDDRRRVVANLVGSIFTAKDLSTPRATRLYSLLLQHARGESTRSLETVYNVPRTKRMHRRTSLLFVVLTLAQASQAHASARVALRWSAPPECPTEEVVLAEVDRLLQARAPSDEPNLDALGAVRKKDDGTYVVRLEIPGPDGPRVREVSAVSCAALGPTTALILAMMIDPEAALTAPENSGSPVPEARPEALVTKPVEPQKRGTDVPVSPVAKPPVVLDKPIRESPARTPISKKLRAARPRLFAGVYLVDDVGSLPSATVGFSGALGVMPGSWKFEVGATYFIGKSSSFSDMPQAGAQVNLAALHVALGRVISLDSNIDIVPRIRLDGGRFEATSFGVDEVARGISYSAGFGAGGVVSMRISKYFRTVLELDGIMLLAHPRFIVTGLGVAHEPSSFVGRLGLGVEVQF